MVKKSLVMVSLVVAFWAAGFVNAYAERQEEVQPVPPVVIKGTVFDSKTGATGAPVTFPLFLRLNEVEENGVVGKEVGYTYLENGFFYFALDSNGFKPRQYQIESSPFVPEPGRQSYLGSSITFPVGYEGAYVSFAVESTWVRVTLDWNSIPKVIPAEGGLLSWGFWVEGNHQNLDVYARVGDLSATGYPASKQVGYSGSSEPMHLASVCNQYAWQSVPVSGKLPNGKSVCVWIFVTEPGNYERVLAWTGFCVPKLLPPMVTEPPTKG